MKNSIIFIIETILITFCLILLPFFGIILYPKNVFYSSYTSIIQDKYKILKETNAPKIIMIAGSSSAFGLDQDLLEKKTGYKVSNIGLHAGFGAEFETELAKANINKNDIVLLGYEWGWCKTGFFNKIGSDLVMSGIDSDIEMYRYIPKDKVLSVMGYLFTFAYKKNTFESQTGVYSRGAFDQNTFQMIYPREEGFINYNEEGYGVIDIRDENGNVSIADDSAEYIKKFKKYVEDRGAKIYFVSSPIYEGAITCPRDDFEKLKSLEEENIGIPYISDPEKYMFSVDYMYNSIDHTNDKGQLLRTQLLINDLRNIGI